jgi:hypothetical protein
MLREKRSRVTFLLVIILYIVQHNYDFIDEIGCVSDCKVSSKLDNVKSNINE